MVKIYLWAGLLAFALSFVFCRVWIPILRRLSAGQNILSYVKEHKKKSGTPTMGGVAFIAAALLAAAIFIGGVERAQLRSFTLSIVVGIFYMAIGVFDDLLKKRHKENLGLKAWQKFFYQSIVALFCGVYCFRVGLTEVYLPFLNSKVEIGWGILPLVIFAFLATVNALNLTDGLDGLAAGTSVPFFLALGILILLQKGDQGQALLSFCFVGALAAYLIFNVSPASVFMGDTGSLALGGFAAALSIFTKNVLYIPILGLCFVLSVISVLVQVIYYKTTKGKRIFLMSPIHHHFQMKGHSECRIAYAYFLVTLILGIVCIGSLL